MRRIWNLFGDGKKQGNPQEGSDGDEDTVEVTNTTTQTCLSKEEIKDHSVEASTPVKEDKSMDGGKKKSKKKRLKLSRSSEAKTPKKKSTGSVNKRKSKEVIPPSDDAVKSVVVAEAREIAAREDNEEFENDGGAMAKSKIKTRDLKWKEESSSEERKKKATTPIKKIVEARDENKADDEEFENDGKATMAKSKIKSRELKWKSEESPQKTECSSEDSQSKAYKKKHSRVNEKVAEAREENKADDEEFENDGKATLAKSKIKTRDLKWKSEESPQKTERSSENRSQSKGSKKKHFRVNENVAEAREENKADDEEFENDGGAMAKSKIKTRDLKWKSQEQTTESSTGKCASGSDSGGDSTEKRKSKKKYSHLKQKVAEARDENKVDDEEFENDGNATMAKSKIKTRDLKWKKDEDTSTPARTPRSNEDASEARSPIRKVAEAREENKADDEEFENEGNGMARSKIKSRDLQWKKEETSKTVPAMSPAATTTTTERKELSQMGSPDPPPRSIMQLLQEKKKETTGRSLMLPPSSPALSSLPVPTTSPVQSTVRMEVKESKVDKSGATRSRHTKREEDSRESMDKSFMRNLRPRLSVNRKSKSRSDNKRAIREVAKPPEKSQSDSTSPSQISQSSPDKSSRERTSTRLDVAASAVDKSMKSIKSIFKKTDDAKKKYKLEELLPHVERTARDVQDARRLMEMLKRNNVLENALFPFQNETLRAHFTSGEKKVDKNTIDLLFKATDFVLDKILYRGEELDEYIDNPLKTFILNRTKCRTMVVENLVRHPEFLPQTWGGRTVVLMRSEEEVTVAPEDDKSKKESRKRED